MVALVLLIGVVPPAAAEPLFTLAGGRAPVGLATDHERQRYWVLDRSSGRLTIEAYQADGTAEGAMNSRDYVSTMQALAFVDGQAYVGDLGGARSQVDVYRVRDPWPGTEINRARVHTLAYPDGAHRAATLLVDASHRMSVVTTGSDPGIYEAPLDAPSGKSSVLTRVADAPDDVTDGTVLRDGRIVLRTRTTLYTLDPQTYAVVDEAELADDERYGWSVTESVTGGTVITGATAALELSEHPVPGPTPAATEAPAEPTMAVDPTEAAETVEVTIAQSGTTLALLTAAGVAALAALIVLIKRR